MPAAVVPPVVIPACPVGGSAAFGPEQPKAPTTAKDKPRVTQEQIFIEGLLYPVRPGTMPRDEVDHDPGREPNGCAHTRIYRPGGLAKIDATKCDVARQVDGP
jgi:hypothetical protein